MFIIQTINHKKEKGYVAVSTHVPIIQNMVHEATLFFKSQKEAYAYIEKHRRYFFQLKYINVLSITELLTRPNVVIQSKDMLKQMIKEPLCRIYALDSNEEKNYMHYDEILSEYYLKEIAEGSCIWEESNAKIVCKEFELNSPGTKFYYEQTN
jgi:hypothetical protein